MNPSFSKQKNNMYSAQAKRKMIYSKTYAKTDTLFPNFQTSSMYFLGPDVEARSNDFVQGPTGPSIKRWDEGRKLLPLRLCFGDVPGNSKFSYSK